MTQPGGSEMVLGYDPEMAKDGKLGAFDWDLIGKRKRRLDVPPPNDKDGIHLLAHRFGGLSQELHLIARTTYRTRSAIMEAMRQIEHLNEDFLKLWKDWRAEDGQDAPDGAGKAGHKGNNMGTGRTGP